MVLRTIAAMGLLLLTPLMAFAQPKPGGTIMFAARQDIDTLDPHITNRAATRKILIQFTDTLTVINPKDGKVLPGLAESWEVARDGKSYTFKLRKNVKFHDGTPFDAAAVKFTFDRIQEPLGAPGVARAFLGPYDGADVVDAYTVRVRLKQPYAPLLRMVGLSPLAPLSPTAVRTPDSGRRSWRRLAVRRKRRRSCGWRPSTNWPSWCAVAGHDWTGASRRRGATWSLTRR